MVDKLGRWMIMLRGIVRDSWGIKVIKIGEYLWGIRCKCNPSRWS